MFQSYHHYYIKTLSESIQVILHMHRRPGWLCLEKPACKWDVGLPLGTWITRQFSLFPDFENSHYIWTVQSTWSVCYTCGRLKFCEVQDMYIINLHKNPSHLVSMNFPGIHFTHSATIPCWRSWGYPVWFQSEHSVVSSHFTSCSFPFTIVNQSSERD